jgi:hypothetical protein
MLVYPDGFICLACNERGTLQKLADKVRGIVSLPYHYKNPWSNWLRHDDLENVINTAHSVLRKYPSQGYYLRMRGITEEVINILQIGYMDNWYTFPCLDERGRIMGATARRGENNSHKSKYITPPNQSSDLLYIPAYRVKKQPKRVWLTFGIIDAISIAMCGYASMSTIYGKRISPSALDKFRCPIYIFPDVGEEKEALKLASALDWRGNAVIIDYPPGCKDPADLFVRDRGLLLDILEKK